LLQESGGNVGIGTAGPTALLTVKDSGSAPTAGQLRLFASQSGASSQYADIRFQDTGDNNLAIITGYTGGTNNYISFMPANSEKMRITQAGNVGIGNAGPTSKLTVNGGDLVVSSAGSATTTISSATSTFAHGLIVDTNSLYVMADTGNVGIGTASPNSLISSTKLGVSGDITINDDSDGYSYLFIDRFSNAFNSGIKFTTAGTLDFAIVEDGTTNRLDIANGDLTSKYLTILSTGNVGIATTSPRYKLDVWGDMAIGTSTNTNVPLLYVDSGTGSGGVGIGTTTLGTALLTVGTTTPSLVVTNNGYVGIGTASPRTGLSISNTQNYKVDIARNYTDFGSAPTTVPASSYLQLGGQEYAVNSYRLITFGYKEATETNSPAYIGYQEISSAGFMYGDLVFGTRDVTTDTTPSERMRITGAGNVGIGTTTPYSKLTINESDDFAFGSFNEKVLDNMEGSLSWTRSANIATATESTIVKTGGQSLKLTASSTEDEVVRKQFSSNQDLSGYERISFWIYADRFATSSATTTQLLSFSYRDTGGTETTSTISFQQAGRWQYQEITLTSTAADKDAINYIAFRADFGGIEDINFYIDQIRAYNSTERSGEMFVGKDGALVLMGRGGVEIGRADGSSNKPGIKVDSAVVEFNQPMSVNVGGDVGMNNDLQFLSTGLSQITSEGPLRIVGGDSNHAENLTLTTGGTGDVIVELNASSSAFMVMQAWAASTTVPFIINSESNSTTTAEMDKLGILFQVISDYSSDENTVFSIDASGNFYYDRGAYTPAADVAENYYITDETIGPGDVVCLSENTSLTVEKCSQSYQNNLIGVISTQPALLMAADFTSARPVALNGRVPVKVSSENGPIAIGDSLTSASSTPGVAMKAVGSGKILGYALEPFDGSSTSSDMIYAFINLQDRTSGDLTVFENSDGNIEVRTMTQNGLATLFKLDEEGALVVDKIKTQQLCVGSVCVSENEFMQVFGAGVGAVLTPDVNATTSGVDASSTDATVPDLPDSVIDSSPEVITTSTEATFIFHSTKDNSTFTCQLDSNMWAGCSSPKTHTDLSVGFHQFQVQAIDAANHEEPSPSIFDWQIIAQPIIEPTTTSTDEIATSTTP